MGFGLSAAIRYNHVGLTTFRFLSCKMLFQNGLITGCENGTKDGKHQRKSSSASKGGLPPHMSFNRAASYNNPHEMFPSTAKLFSGFNW